MIKKEQKWNSLTSIVLRGIESDADNFKKLSCSKKFLTSDTTTKILTLEKYFDVQKLFGWYGIDDLPTRYLETYKKIDYKKYNSYFKDK